MNRLTEVFASIVLKLNARMVFIGALEGDLFTLGR